MFTFGAKTENTRDHGKITRCMDLGKLSGQMEESMKVNMKTIKNMELELFIGPMGESITVLGRKASSMVGVSTS